ncbi:MAG: hypothetical protein PHI24_10520, partial [Desulfitobacteriaceae bacterium]|nr:hypothetical protein [Desulfitobacteriaceae bacterium]
SWTASSDNVGVVAYLIYHGDTLLQTVSDPNCQITELVDNTTYNFSVKAKDAAGNISKTSNSQKVVFSLTAQEITADLTLNSDLIYRDLYINNGDVRLNGHKLTVLGDLIQGNGTLYINGGQLNIAGDYRLQRESIVEGSKKYSNSYGYLRMVNEADYVLVGGSFVTQTDYSQSGYLTAGTLEVKGNFNQKYYDYNFYATGTHKTILSGDALQTVNFERTESKFNILELDNRSEAGVKFTSPLNATTFIDNGCKVTFPNNEVMGWQLSKEETYTGDLYLGGGILDLNGHKLTVSGNLIQSAGTIFVNGGQLEISGDYRLQTATKDQNGEVTYGNSNGYLKMTNEMDSVKVGGNFVMESQYSHYGLLTAGTLEVKGDFTQKGYNAYDNFRTSGTHRTLFSGTALQTIFFEESWSSSSCFNILEITNSSAEGVNFAAEAPVVGEVKATTTPIINSGNINLAASVVIKWDSWSSDLGISGNRVLQKELTIGGTLYLNGGTLDLNGKKLTVNGNLIQADGTLYINGGQLNIAGDYRLQREYLGEDDTKIYSYSYGCLKMVNEADCVLVGGSFVTQSFNSQSGYLTAGTLEVKGNFNQKYYDYNFYATGTHKTILSGDALQTVNFERTESKFNILELQNRSEEGVKFTSPLNATTIINNGCKVTFPNNEVMGWQLSEDETYSGDLYLGGGILDLNGHKLTINGNLIQSAGTVFVNGGQLEISGDYRLQTATKDQNGEITYGYSNGYLKMNNEADYVTVGGSFVMHSQYSHYGLLTAGTLEVKGDFTRKRYSVYDNFRTSGTHRTLFSGTALQTIFFEESWSSSSCFNILEITNTSVDGINFATKASVAGEVKSTITPIINGGNINLATSAVINWDSWHSDLGISGNRVLQKELTIGGTLYLNEGTLNLNGKKLTVNGNLIQAGGTLYINGGQLNIFGDYRIQRESIVEGSKTYGYSSGQLRMGNEADYVLVGGNFITQTEYSHSGYLTAGILEVKGDFEQKYYGYNFYATGTHKTILSGEVLQTVNFERAESKFNILELKNYSTEGVKFTSSLNATTFIDNSCKVTFPNNEVMGWQLSEDETYSGDLYLGGGILDLNGHKLTINGNLIQSAGTVFVNGGQLEISGDYRLQTATKDQNEEVTYGNSNGYLKMNNEADYVTVGGSFVMHSQYSHDGLLTAGTLEVKGDFTQKIYSVYDNFRTSGTHRTLFSGTVLQTISLESSASGYSCFNILEITNSSAEGVNFATRAVVIGEIKATTTPIINGGNINLATSAVINWDSWSSDLGINEDRVLQKDLTIGGTLYLNRGTLDLNGKKLTVNGSLIQASGTLYINGGQLNIFGDYRLQTESIDEGSKTYDYSSGQLRMVNEADYILVRGSFVTQSYYSDDGYLTAGTLEVKGDFGQKYDGYNFYATGTHKTILSGDALQTVNFESAESKFNILELQNRSKEGVKFTSPLNATTIINNGCKVTFPNNEVMGWQLSKEETYNGDLYLGGGILDLNGYKLTVSGNLIQSAGTIFVNGGQLEISGDYRLQTVKKEQNEEVTYGNSNGYLKMNNENDYVTVSGSFVMHSQYSHDGLLTAGTLEVKGDFTQKIYSVYDNFRTSCTHRILFSGTVLQTISLESSASDSSCFNILEITNSSEEGVNFATRAAVVGEVKATTTPIINGGNINLATSAVINWDSWSSDLGINEDRVLQKDLTIGGTLYLNEGILDLNGKKLTVLGDLIQAEGTLYINGGQLNISGDYRVQREFIVEGSKTYGYSSGQLRMVNEADYVLVEGSFITQTASGHDGYLTAGTLEVKGDFEQKYGNSYYSSYENFYATGTHKTILSGEALQTVNFERVENKFNILELKNYSTEGVKFTSPLNATTFIDNGCKVTFPNNERMGWQLTADETYNGDLYLGGGILDLNGKKLTVNGNLIQSAGTVFVNGGQLEISGDYKLQTVTKNQNEEVTYGNSNGYLKMNNKADYVTVGGSFVMYSQYSHYGLLTAGTLEVKGDFTQKRYNVYDNFRTSGTHRTLFSGTVLQTISLESSASGSSCFNILEITNTSAEGVNFVAKAFVVGEVKATTTPIINGGNLNLAASAVINWDSWPFDLGIDEDRTLQKDLTIGGSLYLNGGTLDLNGKNLTVLGNLIQASGMLYINGGQLNIAGDYRLQTESIVEGSKKYSNSYGCLKMANEADYVLVGGSFVTQSSNSHLTAGTLEVKGDFLEKYSYSSYENFYATGTHKTILSGEVLQTVNFERTESKFNILELQNRSEEGVKFTSPLNATTFIDNSCKVTFPNNEVMGWQLSEDETYSGDLYLGGGILDLNGKKLTVNGNLIQSAGTVFVNGGQLEISGDYKLQIIKKDNYGVITYSNSNGYLKMIDGADYVTVGGNFVMESQYSHYGLLTAGTLEVKGDFTQKRYNVYDNFRTSGTHRTLFSGTALQTISLAESWSSNSCFNILEITNSSEEGVNFATRAVVIGEVKATTTPIINGGNLNLAASAVINWDSWPSDLGINENRVLQEDLTIGGTLYLNGGTLNLNGKNLTVNGDLIQAEGILYINGGQLNIAGDYRLQREYIVEGSKKYSNSYGYLRMVNVADYVLVGGNFVTQASRNHNGCFTAGILEVKGDFEQKYYGYNFYATGT